VARNELLAAVASTTAILQTLAETKYEPANETSDVEELNQHVEPINEARYKPTVWNK
jgi:hypothetical protein